MAKEERETGEMPWGWLGRDLVLGGVSALCKLVLQTMNTLEVKNYERYLELVHGRAPEQGLITVTNHRSTLDDPGITGALSPLSFWFLEHQHRAARWVFGANDICFTGYLTSAFFHSGKSIGLERGAGVNNNPGLSLAAERVKKGAWLHVFPEGKVNTTVPDGMLPFKWGVGRVVCEAATGPVPPIVLPYYHRGMENIKAVKDPRIGVGHTVDVLVGEPINLDDLISKFRCKKCKKDKEKEKLWAQITQRIRTSMEELEKELTVTKA